MRKELLRVSTILRYPKKKRPTYIKVMPNKLEYLFSKITPGVDASIQLDEPADIRHINLWTSGKLKENLTAPWFHLLSKYIGTYTETRIICHEEFVGLVDPVKTYILVGAPTNIFYCYMLLRWVYYAVMFGTTSKNKHLAVSIILEKLKQFLHKEKDSRKRMSLSQQFRDRYLYYTIGLPRVKHKQHDETFARIITINMNTLPEGKFKNRKLIC